MRTQFVWLVLGLAICGISNADPAMDNENSAIADPEEVANPPLSWVCLNPDTRQYQAVKATSVVDAQQSIGGDSTTKCKMIPAAAEPERVARELNAR